MAPGLDGIAAAINADGNLGAYRDSSTMSPREWLDRDLVPGGADNQGADKAHLVGYKGHGYIPADGRLADTGGSDCEGVDRGNRSNSRIA
jgi:hypothetical protein